MPHDGEPIDQKPYAFVPFTKKKKTQPGTAHNRLDLHESYSGRLIYRFQTLTPIFVGQGSYALGKDAGFPNVEVIRPFHRVNGIPAIPGSSLKGMARTMVEAISPSCLAATKMRFQNLPGGVSLANSRRNTCQPEDSCPACAIFGRMDQAGKVRFKDAVLVGDKKLQLFRLSALYQPRAIKMPQVYLDKNAKFQGVKFYYHSQPAENDRQSPVEVIPANRYVEGSIDFENLTAAQLGLLFFAMGLDPSIALKIGGGKPLGLGSLQIYSAHLTILGKNHYLSFDGDETTHEGAELGNFVGKMIGASLKQHLLLPTQVTKLAEILKYDPNRQAPEGMY